MMNLNEKFPVSPVKIEELMSRIQRLKIDLNEISEQFTRSSGKGGQKVNKSSSCVVLSYPPLGLVVKMQKDRQRSLNRFFALRELADRIEMKISPETSLRLKEIEKIKKQKSRRLRRSQSRNEKES
jgi:protein subunit release factor B